MTREEILEVKEVKKLLKAKEDLDYVSKGGEGYASCSFMDISVRTKRYKSAKEKARYAVGKIVLKEIL